MKFALQEWKHEKSQVIIAVIQIATVFVLLYYTITTMGITNNSVGNIEQMFQGKSIVYLRDVSDEDYLLHENLSSTGASIRLNKLYQYLKNNKDFCYVPILKDTVDVQGYSGPNMFVSRWLTPNIALIKTVQIGASFGDAFTYVVSQGRQFAPGDFEESDTIPILLGASYTGQYHVGDTITIDSNNITKPMEVIGILQEGSFFPDPRGIPPVFSVDEYIIYPFFNLDESSPYFQFDTQIFQSLLIFPTGTESIYEKETEAIVQIAKENDLYSLSFSAPQAMAESFLRSTETDSLVIRWLLALVATFGFACITTTLLAHINGQMNTIGVHLLVGSSRSHVVRKILLEIAVIVTSGMVIAMLILLLLRGRINHLFLLLGIDLVMIVLFSIIPYLKLRQLEVTSLIRRKE